MSTLSRQAYKLHVVKNYIDDEAEFTLEYLTREALAADIAQLLLDANVTSYVFTIVRVQS